MEHETTEAVHSISSRRQPNDRTMKIVGAIGVGLVLCGLSFYTGVVYQRGHGSNISGFAVNSTSNAGPAGFGGGVRSRRGGIGNVTAVSATSITLQNPRATTTRSYTINSSTAVTNNGSAATVSDIQVGDRVLVGISSSSPTTAASIAINPSFGGPGNSGGAFPTSVSQPI